MGKKLLIIVGLAAAVAAATGVALTVNNNADHPRGADGDPTVVVAQTDADAKNSDLADTALDVDETAEATDTSASDVTESDTDTAEITDDDSDISDTDDDRTAAVTAEYGVIRVVERDTGEEQSPRMLFGQYVNECYLKMFDDCTVEICVSPANGQVSKGTYSIYGDTMYVDYHDDRVLQYQVVYDDDNKIEHIIVPSGEFYIYFG